MLIAGFRPGSRPTFVSAKVGKTIDAQFGYIRIGGRGNLRGEPTRWLKQAPSIHKSVHPEGRSAGVGHWENIEETRKTETKNLRLFKVKKT